MRGNRSEAAAADASDAGALELDAALCLDVSCGGDELVLARPHLQRNRALSRLREHQIWVDPQPDLVRQAEPVEPRRREDDRVEPALPTLAEPRVHVPA